MSMPAEPKQRKPKVSKFQTYAARRQALRFQRLRRRERTVQRQRHHQHFKFRVKVVRTYQLYRQQLSERQAAERTLAHWQPRADDHFPLSLSSIRQWHRIASRDGFAALRPQSTRPHTIEYRVSPLLVGIILTLRRLYGWGGQRIAAEKETRGLGHLSSQTVYALFARHGLPVQIYALKGRSDGIAGRRYAKRRPNQQWHIDLKHVTLTDGTKVYICVIIDDYSRYAVAAVAGAHATTDWVKPGRHGRHPTLWPPGRGRE